MAANHNNSKTNACATTNITNAAYVQLFAATPIPCTKMAISNTSAQPITIAIGVAGSEVDLITIGPALATVIDIGLNVLPLGSALSLESAGATANTGFVSVSLLP